MAILDFLSGPLAPSRDTEDPGFSEWYSEQAEKTGIDPNPDDPRHYYNYREAYEAGEEPTYNEDLKKWKWPSQFKHDLHKDRYIIQEDLSILDTKYERPAKFEDLIIQSFKRKEYEEDIWN